MIDKDLIIRLLQQQLTAQAKLITELRTMIKLLEAQVEILQNIRKKDGSNSSKPPSRDIGKP